MSRAELYQVHLDRVSRSFAFCIRQLNEPLRERVGLSYLLCRLVDTVEDSAWPDLDVQLAAFHDFDLALLTPAHDFGAKWSERLPAGVPESERALMREADTILADLHRLPDETRGVIRDLVLSMSHGMQHFARARREGQLRLRSLAEVNQYCFFVAGVVGELLANLLAQVEPRFALTSDHLLRAHHFGQFLQKVNLLKDQVADEQVGRHLIPSRELVEASAEVNAREALAFLLAVPRVQIEFRRFCAWSLFLGLEAMAVARRSVQEKRVLKVARSTMEALLARVEQILDDEGALKELFASFSASLGWPTTRAHVQVTSFPEWLRGLYHGPLDHSSLVALGLAQN